MGIYSANRSGMMETGTIAANENYTSCDAARIMYESQVNDMAIFEAIIASDLHEAKALQEGTLLESEAVKFNRQNATGILGKLEERLKALWAKIKAAFKDVMNKIAAYVLRDGKAYAKEFKKRYEKKKLNGPVKTRIFNEKCSDMLKAILPDIAVVSKTVKENASNTDSVKTKEVIEKLLNGKSISEFKTDFREAMIQDGNVEPSDVDGLVSIIEDGKKIIARAKAQATNTERKIKDAINYIKSISRGYEADAKSNNAEYSIKNATATCSAFEKVASLHTSLTILAARTQIKQARINLSDVLSEAVAENAVLAEAAALDAEAEVDDAMSPEVTEEIEATPDLKDDVEDIVDSAEVDELAESFLY